jgi:hypothetical protein
MTHDGKTVRMLTLLNEYTRECLAIRMARRLGRYEVIEALADVILFRGIPEIRPPAPAAYSPLIPPNSISQPMAVI